MKVGEICTREVSIIKKQASLLQAAKLMRQNHVGSLIVVDEKSNHKIPLGILTDRDILIQVLSEGISLEKISVEDIMKTSLVSAYEDEEIYEVSQKMQHHAVRRIPILNRKGVLVGILSLDDLLKVLGEEIKNMAEIVYNEREQEALFRS